MTRTRVTADELRERVHAFEAQHPGYDRSNYLDLFRDGAGELVESAEFFEVSRMYQRLARATAGGS